MTSPKTFGSDCPTITSLATAGSAVRLSPPETCRIRRPRRQSAPTASAGDWQKIRADLLAHFRSADICPLPNQTEWPRQWAPSPARCQTTPSSRYAPRRCVSKGRTTRQHVVHRLDEVRAERSVSRVPGAPPRWSKPPTAHLRTGSPCSRLPAHPGHGRPDPRDIRNGPLIAPSANLSGNF
jgi:hypothetical protein